MEQTPTPGPTRKPSKDNPANVYLKYSGMAFEMLATIGVFAAAGYFLDKKIPFEFPLATIILSMLGLGVAFYRIMKQP